MEECKRKDKSFAISDGGNVRSRLRGGEVVGVKLSSAAGTGNSRFEDDAETSSLPLAVCCSDCSNGDLCLESVFLE